MMRSMLRISPQPLRQVHSRSLGATAVSSRFSVVPHRAVFQQTTRAMAREAKMFCFQCEQTLGGKGCITKGVCGKTPEVANLQDLLVHNLKGLSQWTGVATSHLGLTFPHEAAHAMEALFATLTNVNNDPDRIHEFIKTTVSMRDNVRAKYEAECAAKGETPRAPGCEEIANFTPANINDLTVLEQEGHTHGVMGVRARYGEDVAGVHELVMYGLKGLAAYATHARMLGMESPEVQAFVLDTLGWMDSSDSGDLNASLGRALEVGAQNVTVLELLDRGHTSRYGNPVPTEVNLGQEAGKCILVSGHDLRDLESLLEQTTGKGINVYTHGEMLPAHGYPGLKKHPHLKGNYGGAWQLQKMEFGHFPGPVIVTTNCLIEPRDSYRDNLWTMNAVGWPGVKHIEGRDFSPVIDRALEMPGFAETTEAKYITTGFGHATVLGVADKVIAGVQAGHIERLHVIGGCDGSELDRSYYTDLATSLPPSHMVFTLGCGKYRFNKLEHGTVPNVGLPRLLDMGQCNDAYSAVVVASALAKHFDTDINGLPLSVTLSWFEQKAVAVLLSLLHLNVQNITIGPSLPAFITPNVLGALVEKFNIKPIPR